MNAIINNQPRPYRVLSLEDAVRMSPSVGADHPSSRVSERYTFVPTTEFISLMQSAGWDLTSIQDTSSRSMDTTGFGKHLLKFNHASLVISEKRFIQTWVTNAHNGLSNFILGCGAQELVCSNGLYLFIASFGEIRIRHINVTKDEVFAASERMLEHAPKVGKMITAYEGIKLTEPERLAFAESAMPILFGQDQPFDPANLLKVHRWSDRNRPDLWATYNIVQENAMKGGIKYFKQDEEGKVRKTSTRAIKAIDRNVDINRALFMLAEKMAQLKGVEVTA
jgi:hypothetical protein